MKTHIRVMLAALFAGLAIVVARAEPYQMVGFGDSLMAGYGLQPGEGFPEKLEKALKSRGHDVVIKNAGVSGDTTSGGLARLDWSIPDGTKFVILELGANDMLRGIAPGTAEENLDAMLARLTARHINVLLAGMLATPSLGPEYKKDFDAIYPRLAAKYNVELYPFFLDAVATDQTLLLDGLHPTAAGVDRMVEKMLPIVERMLSKP